VDAHQSSLKPFYEVLFSFCTTRSKGLITKVMSLAAVARQRWDTAANRRFCGKIGIWPFISIEPALRNSRNRPAGTPVTKPISSVTADVYREFVIQKLLPAINSKRPLNERANVIKIQQDNAKPHLSPTDNQFLHAAQVLNLNVQLTCQPPNSPDLNILDLGFFHSIQSLQYSESPTTIEDLIAAVVNSYNAITHTSLNDIFLTLQKVMESCILSDGNNNFKTPHCNKRRLENSGRLPISLALSLELEEKLAAA